jgi:hypothetical protein
MLAIMAVFWFAFGEKKRFKGPPKMDKTML